MKKIKMFAIIMPVLLLAQGCSSGFFGGSSGSLGGALKSSDSGESWRAANLVGERGSLAGASIARVRMDWDNHDILYMASPTHGVYQSVNAGDSWTRVLSNVRTYDLQINPKNPAEILAGGIEAGKAKLFKTEDKGQTWVEVFSEASSNNLVSAIAYDPANTQTVYIGLSTGEIILSRNGGISWDLVNRLRGRILKLYLDSGDTRRMFALSMEQGLYKTADGGANWALLTSSIDRGSLFQNFYVLKNPGYIYLASSNGLHASPDDGATWNAIELPKNENSKIVSAFAVSPKDRNEIYATVLQTLYKSTDGGITWQTRALSTPASVRDFAVNPEETNIIYAGLGEVLQ